MGYQSGWLTRQHFTVILSQNRTAHFAQFYKIVLHTFKFLLHTLCSKTHYILGTELSPYGKRKVGAADDTYRLHMKAQHSWNAIYGEFKTRINIVRSIQSKWDLSYAAVASYWSANTKQQQRRRSATAYTVYNIKCAWLKHFITYKIRIYTTTTFSWTAYQQLVKAT